MKRQKIKKILVYLISLLGFLLVFFACLGAWLASGHLNATKISVIKNIPYPLAIVNGSPIMASDFLERYNLFLKHGSSMPANILEQNAADGLIQEKQIQQLAMRYDATVPKKQLDNEFNARLLAPAPLGGVGPKDFLKNYGLSENAYKNQILRPLLQKINLQTWFFGQKKLNTQAYTLAEDLQNKIQAGQDMGELANSYTQDPQGKLTKGDMGFVGISEILPELQETVDSMQVGDVKIAPSRFGLHILKLEEKDTNGTNNAGRFHIRQIYLTGSDFDSWLNLEAKKLTTKRLISI